MKHKNFYLLFFSAVLVLGLIACDVKLKDKQDPLAPVTEEGPENKPEDPPLEVEGDPVVIDGPVVLKDHQNIEVSRLHLTKNAVITTEDKNLVIVVQELVSDGGVIRNFPEDQRAPWEKNGRNGGSVFISVKKAVGTLQVHLQGEGGGSGRHGPTSDFPNRPHCVGTNGGNGGNAGTLRAEIADNQNFNLSYQNREGALGPAGLRGGTHSNDKEAAKGTCYIDRPEGLGGKPGERGQICLKLGTEEKFRCGQ